MIIGLNFTKVLVEKNPIKDKQKVSKIGAKTEITSIEEEKVEIPDKKAFRTSFSFSISYEPNLANLSLEGSLLYLDNSEKITEALALWKKKEIKPELRLELLNYILSKCNVKAISLEDDFNLPTHLPMPKFQIQQEKKDSKKSDDNSVKTDYAD
jgi:hypothetical protein